MRVIVYLRRGQQWRGEQGGSGEGDRRGRKAGLRIVVFLSS